MKAIEQIKTAEETIKLLQDYIELVKSEKRLKTATMRVIADEGIENCLEIIRDNVSKL